MPARRDKRRPSVDEAFGQVLRELRLELGLSQERLGALAGSGRTFVSQLERGERGASLKTVFRLAEQLSVDASEMVRLAEAAMD